MECMEENSRDQSRLSCRCDWTLARLDSIPLTFVDGEIGDRLPPVHGHTPSAFDASTAEVNDELVGVTAERGQYSLQAVERECARGKEERRDDDLPRWERRNAQLPELLREEVDGKNAFIQAMQHRWRLLHVACTQIMYYLPSQRQRRSRTARWCL